MKMKFVTDAVVMVEGKPEILFPAGDIQDLNPHSAERWRRRGVAVEVLEEEPQEPRAPQRKRAPKAE